VRRRSLTASKGFSGVGTWFGRQGEALVWWRIKTEIRTLLTVWGVYRNQLGRTWSRKEGCELSQEHHLQTNQRQCQIQSCITYSRRTHCIIFSSSLFLPRMWTCKTANLKCILLTQAVEICQFLTPSWNLQP
jgi:hypothetical protein